MWLANLDAMLFNCRSPHLTKYGRIPDRAEKPVGQSGTENCKPVHVAIVQHAVVHGRHCGAWGLNKTRANGGIGPSSPRRVFDRTGVYRTANLQCSSP